MVMILDNPKEFFDNLSTEEFLKLLNEMDIKHEPLLVKETIQEIKNFNNKDIEEVFEMESLDYALDYVWQQGSWMINKNESIPNIKELFRERFNKSEKGIKAYRGVCFGLNSKLTQSQLEDYIKETDKYEFMSCTSNLEVAKYFANLFHQNYKYYYRAILEVTGFEYYNIKHRDMGEDEIIFKGPRNIKLIQMYINNKLI